MADDMIPNSDVGTIIDSETKDESVSVPLDSGDNLISDEKRTEVPEIDKMMSENGSIDSDRLVDSLEDKNILSEDPGEISDLNGDRESIPEPEVLDYGCETLDDSEATNNVADFEKTGNTNTDQSSLVDSNESIENNAFDDSGTECMSGESDVESCKTGDKQDFLSKQLSEYKRNNDDGRYNAKIEDLNVKAYGYQNIGDLPLGNIHQTLTSSWTGLRGDSICIPPDTEDGRRALEICKSKGASGVSYINSNPDFRPFTKYNDEKLGSFTGEVVIPSMACDSKVIDDEGKSHKLSGRTYNDVNSKNINDPLTVSDMGNYRQADEALARKLNVPVTEIKDYRKNNELTWHECGDMVTMQLVPTDLHKVFKHAAGVSAVSNEIKNGDKVYDEPRFYANYKSNRR